MQLGSILLGNEVGDRYGSVSMNESGSIVAIASTGTNGSTGSGYLDVKIYDSVNDQWVARGNRILNPRGNPGSFSFQNRLALGGDRLFIGSPSATLDGIIYVYDYDYASSDYVLSSLLTSSEGRYGTLLDVSSNGNRLITSTGTTVMIYELTSSGWVVLGTSIPLNANALAMSRDGSSIAIGIAGVGAKIFTWDGMQWLQKGQDLNYNFPFINPSNLIDFSDDGNTIAISSAVGDMNIGSGKGWCRVYDYDGSTWVQRGNIIEGSLNERLGKSIDLSGDGEIILLGGNGNSPNGSASGFSRVYRWYNGEWTDVNVETLGDNSGDRYGSHAAMSNNGERIILGTNNSNNLGYAKVYSIREALRAFDFVMEWDIQSINTQVIIPTTGTGYSYDISWGDGQVDRDVTSNAAHIYTATGTYQIRITGEFPQIDYGSMPNYDSTAFKEIEQWGRTKWRSMDDAFMFLMNMQSVTNDTPDLSNCTSLRGMFAHSRFNSNINNWDVSNITDMSLMFFQAQDFDQSLNSWNVSGVQYFNSMFNHATAFNGDISNWNLLSASNLNNLFNNATRFNQDISNWDTSNVINMQGVFAGATSFNQQLDNWDVSSVTDFSLMFAESSFNLPLTSWNTQSATNMRAMFAASAFNQSINHFDTSQVIDMVGMFFFNDAFNQNLDNWDTSQVTDISMMFNDAAAFNQNLSSWNIENLTQAADMFTNSDIDVNNYTQLLQSWSQQTVNNNVTLSVGPQYCSAAQPFRDVLTNVHGWSITDGGVDTSANCTLSLEELEQSSFELYPNPATNRVNIDCGDLAFAKAEIFNLQGQQVATAQSNQIAVGQLKAGIYLIRVTSTSGQQVTQRFIKK